MVSYVPNDMEAILKSLGTETDRAVALVGASLVEYALEEAIKCRLRPLDKKEEKADLDRLFGINGIFSGLSSKIIGAYALGLIGPVTRRDLDLINKIRNEFAHDMNPLSFSDVHIKSRCREIKLLAGDPQTMKNDDARVMYLVAISMLAGSLWVKAHPEGGQIPELTKLLDT